MYKYIIEVKAAGIKLRAMMVGLNISFKMAIGKEKETKHEKDEI